VPRRRFLRSEPGDDRGPGEVAAGDEIPSGPVVLRVQNCSVVLPIDAACTFQRHFLYFREAKNIR
jgi:hypothetical protein